MSAHEQSRYYWIKIKTDFLTSKEIDYLMRQKGGSDYVVLYQSLCLLAINNKGVLADKIGEILVPYDDNKIHGLTKGWFSIDTVRIGLALFTQLGLVYQDEGGIFKLADFENLVGSETYAAIRMRNKRDGIKKLEERTNGEQCSLDNKSLEYRDLDNNNLDSRNNKENIVNTPNVVLSKENGTVSDGDYGHGTNKKLPF